jgi:hypothetical protein
MILVTGATGKNGMEILKRLAPRRERIRAMVRKRNEMMAVTLHSEPEFVEADFDDAVSLRKALSGVQRAFLVTNSSERVEERQLRFVSLAREAGVKHIVYLSQLHASLESPLRFLRYLAAGGQYESRVSGYCHRVVSGRWLLHIGDARHRLCAFHAHRSVLGRMVTLPRCVRYPDHWPERALERVCASSRPE